MKADKSDCDDLDVFFEDVKLHTDRLATLLGSLFGYQEVFREALEKIVEFSVGCMKASEPALMELKKWGKDTELVQIPLGFLQELAPLATAATSLREFASTAYYAAFEKAKKAFNKLPSRITEALGFLAQEAWFPDMRMTAADLEILVKTLKQGGSDDANAELVSYFENRLDDIEESIRENFPARERFVKAAFRAHRNQDYIASVPLFLIQSDGICLDITGAQLFEKRSQDELRVVTYIEKIKSATIQYVLLSPLTGQIPLTFSENERPPGFSGLNRHTVIHGESLDYDTKANSLKAVSLISYIAHTLGDDRISPSS